MKCTWCDNDLDSEERQRPRRDTDGDAICDSCYRDEYMSTCCWCEDYHLKSEQGTGAMLAVFDPDYALIGMYRALVESPGEEWYTPGEIELVAPGVPIDDPDGTFWPWGWVCEECVRERAAKMTITHIETIHGCITAEYPTSKRTCIEISALLAKADGSNVSSEELDEFYADFSSLVFVQHGFQIGGTVRLSEACDPE